MLTKIKLYLYGAAVALVSLLVGLLKFYKGKARDEEKRADRASEGLSKQKDIQRADNAIEEKFEERREASSSSSVFRDPNKLFRDDSDST